MKFKCSSSQKPVHDRLELYRLEKCIRHEMRFKEVQITRWWDWIKRGFVKQMQSEFSESISFDNSNFFLLQQIHKSPRFCFPLSKTNIYTASLKVQTHFGNKITGVCIGVGGGSEKNEFFIASFRELPIYLSCGKRFLNTIPC